MKKQLGTAFSFAGAVIGAGMMTGAEIGKYFGTGRGTVFTIGLASVIIAFLLYILTSYASRQGIVELKDLGASLFGKHAVFFNIFVYICIVSCCGAMLAGIGELLMVIFHIPSFITSAIVAILGSLIAYNGISFVKWVNMIAVPVIMVFVFVLLFFKGDHGHGMLQHPYKSLIFSIYNVAFALPLCCSINEKHKVLRNAFVIFGIIIFTVMLSISMVIPSNGISELPLFDAVLSISDGIVIVYVLCLLSASLSTYITSMVGFSQSKPKMLAASVISYLISLMKIDNIIKYVYPISGILCIICIVKIIVRGRKI